MKMKAPIVNQIAANPLKLSWTTTTILLWIAYLYVVFEASGSIGFYFQFPVFLLHILILALLPGAAFFIQIPLWIILGALSRKVNRCDFSEGNQVTILKGKHKNRIVTVSEVSQGQGGPKHHVIIIDEKYIPIYKERFFEENEVGPPELLIPKAEPGASGQRR